MRVLVYVKRFNLVFKNYTPRQQKKMHALTVKKNYMTWRCFGRALHFSRCVCEGPLGHPDLPTRSTLPAGVSR